MNKRIQQWSDYLGILGKLVISIYLIIIIQSLNIFLMNVTSIADVTSVFLAVALVGFSYLFEVKLRLNRWLQGIIYFSLLFFPRMLVSFFAYQNPFSLALTILYGGYMVVAVLFWNRFLTFLSENEPPKPAIANRNERIIDKTRNSIAGSMAGIILISYLLNQGLLKKFPDISTDIIGNFLFPTIMILLGMYLRNLKKGVRYLLLGVFGFYFGYLALHYLIGFHNPLWGN